ncbi:hypothetical protein PSHT_02687 [Puccinia striiformis]|uniref:Uncharacterized protein n=2 Tax=Puccinia striiformis TaxID=27350 RepID=A0A2S4WHF0_9BASI|nr:hypothetical protein PSTT_10349 [Puccinia striiformis]POW21194.1 hypothetical protein PSHT_02687 [Puccinia striiformis]
MKTTRTLNHDMLTSELSADVDPFAYISHLGSSSWLPPLTTGTIIFLAVLLAFHISVAAISLIILLLPHVGKTKRESWFLRKLYIHASSGKKVYNTPLYLVNTGILMSIWEFLGSIATQVYLLLQIAIHVSPQFASRTESGPALSVMLICNIYSYWSTAHGFLTLSYTNKIFVDDPKNLRWLRSPLLINVSFIIFPMSVAVAIAILQANLSLTVHEAQVELRTRQATLTQGSLAWNQLQHTHSSDDQERLLLQIAQSWAKVDSSTKLFEIIVQSLRDKFLLLRSAMLASMLATTLVFVFSFWKLTRTFNKQGRGSSNSTYLKSDCSGPSTKNCSIQKCTSTRLDSSTEQSLFKTMRSDRQFFRLTMRASAILLGILTGLTYWLLVSFRIDDVLLNPNWHGLMTWLPALSGSWAAVPLTLQSWQLYQDQKKPPVGTSGHREDVIPTHIHFTSETVTQVVIGQAPEAFPFNHDHLSEIKNMDQTSSSQVTLSRFLEGFVAFVEFG